MQNTDKEGLMSRAEGIRYQRAKDGKAEQTFRDEINREVKLAMREHRPPDIERLKAVASHLGINPHKSPVETRLDQRDAERRISEAVRAGRR